MTRRVDNKVLEEIEKGGEEEQSPNDEERELAALLELEGLLEQMTPAERRAWMALNSENNSQALARSRLLVADEGEIMGRLESNNPLHSDSGDANAFGPEHELEYAF